MRRKDWYISFSLLLAGILLHPLYKAIAGELNWPLMIIGFVLTGSGIAYQFYALYRNKQYARLKWQAIRFGVMLGVLLLLFMFWGDN